MYVCFHGPEVNLSNKMFWQQMDRDADQCWGYCTPIINGK